jgi:hypothetical protein
MRRETNGKRFENFLSTLRTRCLWYTALPAKGAPVYVDVVHINWIRRSLVFVSVRTVCTHFNSNSVHEDYWAVLAGDLDSTKTMELQLKEDVNILRNLLRVLKLNTDYFLCVHCVPPLRSGAQNSWLQIQRSRARFSALPDFLRSGGSGTGSTQPHADNGSIWMEK